MKRYTRKAMSVLLSALSLLLLLTPAFSVSAANTCDCGKTPVVYVIGKTDIYDSVTDPTRQLPREDKDAILEAVETALPYAAQAIFLNRWDEYCAVTYDLIAPFFEGFAPDPDGEIRNGSGVLFKWSEEELAKKNHKNDSLYNYRFEYDCRRSPMDVADDLNAFVEAVKRVTGHSKVAVISRCVGTNYALAYLYQYARLDDYRGIDTAVFYNGSMNGLDTCEDCFSGNVRFTGDAAYRYCSNSIALGDDILNEFLQATIVLLQETYGVRLTCELLNAFYDKIYDTLIVDVLKISYGATAGFWSMNRDRFEEGKEYIFSAEGDLEKYAGLIEKIDAYHYDVQMKTPTILNAMQKSGVSIAVLCKYGFQGVPVTGQADKISDGAIAVDDQSFGATCANMNEVLDEKYLAFCSLHGLDKYISPDLQIDASTGLFPDTTWYIKNLEHNPFPPDVDPLLRKICWTKGFTVASDTQFPQFLLYTYDSIAPLTKENCQNIDWDANNDSLWNLFKRFWLALKALVEKLLNEKA